MPLEPISFIERTILTNQFRILAQLNGGEADDYNQKAEIFENGLTGLYTEALQYMNTEETSYDVCRETYDILTMYKYIRNAIASLTPAQSAQLDLNAIRFDGFDGNNDDHYGFARFMIERQGKYTEHVALNLDSHSMASMMRYKKMLPVYKGILAQQVRDFNAADLQSLIEAVNA